MLQQGSSHPPGSILARLQVPNLVNKKRRRMIKIDNFGYVHIVTTHTLRHKNLPAISCIFFFFFFTYWGEGKQCRPRSDAFLGHPIQVLTVLIIHFCLNVWCYYGHFQKFSFNKFELSPLDHKLNRKRC